MKLLISKNFNLGFICLLLCLAFMPTKSQAQEATDCYTVTTETYDPIVFTPGATTFQFTNNSAFSSDINIGFIFRYFGVDYTTFILNPNGFASFTFLAPGFNGPDNPIPNAVTEPVNSIMFGYQPLAPSVMNPGTVTYEVTGTAPNRIFKLHYEALNTCDNAELQQIGFILYETTNIIDVVLETKTDCGPSTEGIQNSSGTIAFTATGRNDSAWGALNDTVRFTPFLPSVITGPTSVCTNETAQYTLPTIQGATSFTWSILPDDGPTFVGPTDGDTITLSTGNTSGVHVLSVTVENSCSTPFSTSLAINIVSCASPINPGGFQTKNKFLTQTDIINVIRWSPPADASTVVAYIIYRDAALTDVAGEVLPNQFKFRDHNRTEGVIYTYYIVSLLNNGNRSDPTVITVFPK